MPFLNPGRNTALDAIGAVASFISFHTDDPGSTGVNEVASGVYSRPQTGWSAASSGSKVGTAVTATIPANTRITHWALWSQATGGTPYYSGLLPAPESYGAQGQVIFTPSMAAA